MPNFSATASATIHPALCRDQAYSGPGFPSPTIRRNAPPFPGEKNPLGQQRTP